MVSPGGVVRRLELDTKFSVVAAVPDHKLSTEEARKATADPVATAVASRTAARLAFLIEGLRTGDPGVLGEASGDELHERRRAHLAPIAGVLMDAAREAGAAYSAWSGAGPSVVAFVTEDVVEGVEEAWHRVFAGSGTVLALSVAESGVRIE
jgi:homoserine kinase